MARTGQETPQAEPVPAVRSRTPVWTIAVPVLTAGFAVLSGKVLGGVPGYAVPVALIFLFASVFAAVHHAESIAARIGQVFGAILLAVSVTIIEVALIVSVLLGGGPGTEAVARDTVFASIMIVLNGIVGACLLAGGVRFHEQGFQARGATAALGVLGTVAVLALVLPNFTISRDGPVYAPPQLVFVAVVALLLYGVFLYVQMVRHPGDFREVVVHESPDNEVTDRRAFLVALGLLPVSLLAVVLLAEELSPHVEQAVGRAGLPAALVGVAIAMLVLMPEATASLRAAKANRLQTALNLALGSALASICLTIPTVAILSLVLGRTLVLGLDSEHIVLLVLSLFMATLTLAVGRTTVLQGAIHIVIFGAFLTISAFP